MRAGFSYTKQDGFSAGPKLSALNLGGRAISLGARAYFGGAMQYSARLTWPFHFHFASGSKAVAQRQRIR